MTVFKNVKFWSDLRWATSHGRLPFTADGRDTALYISSNGLDNRENPILKFEVPGIFTYVVSFQEKSDGRLVFGISFGWLHEGVEEEDAEHYLSMLRLQLPHEL